MKRLLVLIASLLFSFTLPNTVVQAANFTASDAASLIAAINAANSNSEADAILLMADITLTDVYEIIASGDNGLPAITSDITIIGNGHSITRDAGAPPFRILEVLEEGALTVIQTTLSGGYVDRVGFAYLGGAIFNYNGFLTLIDTTISNNIADEGGGVYTLAAISGTYIGQGTLTIINSTFTGNSTSVHSGGAVFIRNGTVNITNTTFSNNSANGGGAIFIMSYGSVPTDVTITNSTFTGNDVDFRGGGISVINNGAVSLYNATFTGNSAAFNTGGGIYSDNIVMLTNSLVTGNTFLGSASDCNNWGIITNAYNILGSNGSGNGCPIGANDGVPGGPPSTVLNPTLADNGGPTQTHALVTGSPAIDVAINGATTTDQRGAPISGAARDSGAFEFGPTPTYPTVAFTGDMTVTETDGTVNIPLTVSGAANFGAIAEVYVFDMGTGTATPGADYNPVPLATLSIDCSGGTCPTSLSVPLTIIDDGLTGEPDETVNLALVGTNGFATIGSPAAVTMTIQEQSTTITPTVSPDNTPTHSPGVAAFDPAISKLGFLVPGQVGVIDEQIEWLVTVSNPSSVAGQNVVITDTVDSRLQINSVDAPGGLVSINGQTISVTYASLVSGQSVQFSIYTTVLDGESVDNTACISSTNLATERCATGTAVDSLPDTGETPYWRQGLFIATSAIFVVITALSLKR